MLFSILIFPLYEEFIICETLQFVCRFFWGFYIEFHEFLRESVAPKCYEYSYIWMLNEMALLELSNHNL